MKANVRVVNDVRMFLMKSRTKGQCMVNITENVLRCIEATRQLKFGSRLIKMNRNFSMKPCYYCKTVIKFAKPTPSSMRMRMRMRTDGTGNPHMESHNVRNDSTIVTHDTDAFTNERGKLCRQ